jgi:hypothetical protein
MPPDAEIPQQARNRSVGGPWGAAEIAESVPEMFPRADGGTLAYQSTIQLAQRQPVVRPSAVSRRPPGRSRQGLPLGACAQRCRRRWLSLKRKAPRNRQPARTAFGRSSTRKKLRRHKPEIPLGHSTRGLLSGLRKEALATSAGDVPRRVDIRRADLTTQRTQGYKPLLNSAKRAAGGDANSPKDAIAT